MATESVSIRVIGRVQGVWFRVSAKEKADALGITGFVRNADDGSVYIEAEGDEVAVRAFIEWCHTGPRHAVVENVDVQPKEFSGFTSFEITR